MKNLFPYRGGWFIICVVCILISSMSFAQSTVVCSGSVVGIRNGLVWDPVTDNDLSHYRVHFGQTPETNAFSLDIQGTPPPTEFDFRMLSSPLATGGWCASVSAVDIYGNESPKSDPIGFTFDSQAPSVPMNLKIK